ncbi:MAG TPA: hypothetical protein VFI13_11815 [Gemmatimonadales bacterium]|nr:hypothetical protein [Gemmatimonadales bacterium]
MTKAAILLSTVLGAGACRMDARQQAAFPDASTARPFVVGLYEWYHPDSATYKDVDQLLSERRSSLTPDLAALLAADRDCAARSHEICNLDFDPMSNSQDPCDVYEVGGAAPEHGTIAVPIYAVCAGRRDSIPTVIVMLVGDSAGWKISNLVYDAGKYDLRGILSRKASE